MNPSSLVDPARASEVTLRAADGVRLQAELTRRPGRSELDLSLAVVLVPGFSGWARKPGVSRVVGVLADYADVIQVDLRGHGRSDGRSTLSDREVFDVDAAVAYARTLGYHRVLTLGFSMGGSAVLRQAALVGETVYGFPIREPVDAVATVSTGSAWYITDTKPMRRLHFLVLNPVGRFIARRVFKVRIDPSGWRGDPLSPLDAAARIAVPRLVVHGDRDAYLTTSHAEALAATGAGPVELWMEHGYGHAEEAADTELLRRLGSAVVSLADNGRVVSTRSVTVRYWAAARDAAGCASEELAGATLADVLRAAAAEHGPELARLLAICSFLVDGTPVKRTDAAAYVLDAGTDVQPVIEVLPPFAGGA